MHHLLATHVSSFGLTHPYQFPLFNCTNQCNTLLCFEMSEDNNIKLKYIRIEPPVTNDEGNFLFLQNEMMSKK